MKKIVLTVTTVLLAGFMLISFVPAKKQQDNKPKAVYQVGSSKVVVWEDKKSDGTTWKNFRVEKVYKKGDEWATTNSFNETELLELKAALDKAISEETVTRK